MLKELIANNGIYFMLTLIVIFSCGVGLVIHNGIYRIYGYYLKSRRETPLHKMLVYSRKPLYVILPFCIFTICISFMDLGAAKPVISLIFRIMLIVLSSWLLIKVINYSEVWLERKYQNSQGVWSGLQKSKAKIYILKKAVIFFVIIVTVALILLNFDTVKEIGKGILVSASVLGIIAGVAIQKPLAHLFSGLQVAFTQPLKIGDNVVVAGEFGTIEVISLTNVTIRLWDLRRLILPITYLLENPYQNWTHPSGTLIGTIFIYVDYSVNVDRLREALSQILEQTPLWDEKFNVLQVTELKEQNMELRILVSAKDPGDLWNLRCHVREKLVRFIKENFPSGFPKIYTKILMDEPKDSQRSFPGEFPSKN